MSISLQPEYPNPPLVAPLTIFGHGSLAIAGGKAANLGELIRAGFDVPPGFVITTAVYDLLLQTGEMQRLMREMLPSLQVDNPGSVAEVSLRISDAIQHASIPGSIADEAIRAYRQLGNGAVAVRSS